MYGEGGEIVVFSAKRCDCRDKADFIESAITCHGAPVVRSYLVLNQLHLTVLPAKLADYITHHNTFNEIS